jgi:hypothetical protein
MNATPNGFARRWRALCAAGLGFAIALMSPPATRAAEIVPSIGLTRAADSDEIESNYGLALRGSLMIPLVQSEIGVSYRREEYFGGDLAVKMIPVTASLLLRPVPSLHADAGVGWYHTKYDYRDPLVEDETRQVFGVHLGGGLQVPLAPMAALDLTGRYVFLQDQEAKLVPGTFSPDFWSMSLGVALKL